MPPDRSAPTFSATPLSPTALNVTITPPASVAGPYNLTATPASGGQPIVVTCPTAVCTLSGLQPGTLYAVSATGTDSSGIPTPASRQISVATLTAATGPAVDVVAQGPSAVRVTISSPPGVGGPYLVTATPAGGGSPVTLSCATGGCTLTGLTAGATYSVTASGVDGSGNPTPASAPTTVAMPAVGWVCGGEVIDFGRPGGCVVAS